MNDIHDATAQRIFKGDGLLFNLYANGLDEPRMALVHSAREPIERGKIGTCAENEWLAQRNACGGDLDCLRGSYERRLCDLLKSGADASRTFSWTQTRQRGPVPAKADAHIRINRMDSTHIQFFAAVHGVCGDEWMRNKAGLEFGGTYFDESHSRSPGLQSE